MITTMSHRSDFFFLRSPQIVCELLSTVTCTLTPCTLTPCAQRRCCRSSFETCVDESAVAR